MSLSARILIFGIVGLIVLNTALAWTLWRVRNQSAIISTTPVATALIISTTAIPVNTTISTDCRIALDSYIDQSNQRVYAYFDIYNSINKIATETLIARIDTLSKSVDPLPEGCPDNLQAAIHANYVSVYMTAPIHLHMIVTRTNTDGSMTGVAKQALRMFEREIDIAERTNYELLRLAQ